MAIKRNATPDDIEWTPLRYLAGKSYLDWCAPGGGMRAWYQISSGEIVLITGNYETEKAINKEIDKIEKEIAREKAESENEAGRTAMPVRPERGRKFVLFLSDDEHRELKAKAIREDMSINAYIRRKVLERR